MLVNRTHVQSLGLAALLACALPALAQELQNSVQAETDVVDARPFENRYRIGLDCQPSDAALKSHLHLDADSGLTVKMVLPNSPAAIAGIQQHDVIVEANGRRVGTVMALVEQVNLAADSEMAIVLLRAGEEHIVKITPEERDENEIQRLRDGFQRQLGRDYEGIAGDQWGDIMKRFPQMNQFGNGAFRRINPGFAIPQVPNVPDSFALRIERHNDKIIVQRGNDRFEVTVDTLDQLPDDVRPLVENMLNGGNGRLRGLFAPGLDMPLPMPAKPAPPANPNRQLEDRFDGLELQLKQLQDAIKRFEDDN